jgi:hypothetical protein
MFDVASCRCAADMGRLDDWVHAYLGGGPWANSGLSDGLRRQPRFWIGPLLLPLDQLVRCCGPEPTMEFPVAADNWQHRVSTMAVGFNDAAEVPPVLVEWRAGTLSVRDGNHRVAAMTKRGWAQAWALAWCNSTPEFEAARAALLSA